MSSVIIGIDLAWGDKKSDGVCIVEADRNQARVKSIVYPHGDEELIQCIQAEFRQAKESFITVDAPIVCPNKTGTRPVDRLTHTMFHREHAACHPANSTKCPRPIRVLKKLQALGCEAGFNIKPNTHVVAEVYPHPAMVRLFKLDRIVKYKKGKASEKKIEFLRLQRLMLNCMNEQFPFLSINKETETLLSEPWSKLIEDKTDALFCALIGLWHWKHKGKRSQVIGDLKTGFILLPEDLRNEQSIISKDIEITKSEKISPSKIKRRKIKAGKKTTEIGNINRNKQVVRGKTNFEGNDHLQYVYILQCLECKHVYGVNGSDVFQRKCPQCQGGKKGLDFK